MQMAMPFKNLLAPKVKSREASMPEPAQVWHTLSVQQTLEALASQVDGLSLAESDERLGQYGANRLPEARPPALWQIFLHQFASPLIYILIAAGVISLLINHPEDAGFIFAIILFNAILGTYQEYQAEKSAKALQSLLHTTATVMRQGRETSINAEQLAPGDIVLLASGHRIPADIRLIEVNQLAIDEAMLTGESLPSEKSTEALGDSKIPASDRHNMAFAGSTVTAGRGKGIVVGTGLNTEIGKIAELVTGKTRGKTPLITRMENFANKLVWVIMIAVVVLGTLALWQGHPPKDVFMLAVALAVAVIPEGLPVAMTVALSIGSRRMSNRNVIVRKLMAVEGLGSCTCIASDKTGTLTLNRQTVNRILLANGTRFHVTGEGYDGEGEILNDQKLKLQAMEQQVIQRIAHAAIISNEAHLVKGHKTWSYEGDPLDVALVAMGYKAGLHPAQSRESEILISEIPYESERQYAARFFQANKGVRVIAKGAGEKLFPLCKQALGHQEQLEPVNLAQLEKVSNELAREGFRVIAIAEGFVETTDLSESMEHDVLPELTLLCLIGMIDPLRPEARDAIQKCQAAGVRVVMITGDHPATAMTIAHQLGIADGKETICTGAMLKENGNALMPETLDTRLIETVSVYARVTPVQKLAIVEALKHVGHLVAVTGDGVNDTPALKAANIGVAMGSGSDIAKDTATIIVTDDNFASIVSGVEEGRFAYANVRKVILLLLPPGFATLMLVSLSMIANLPLPLTAIQLLWLNLVANGIQDVALAFEAGEPAALKRPPRDPAQGIFDRLMIQQSLLIALTISIIGFGLILWMHHNGFSEFEARNMLLLLLVLMANFHALNCRSEYQSTFKIPLRNNWFLLFGIVSTQALHIVAMHIPVTQRVLAVGPVNLPSWLLLLGLASSTLIVMEVFKWLRQRNHNPPKKAA